MSDSIQYKGYTIKVETEDDPCNPRTEWYNIGTMVCFHGNYNLGDDKKELSTGEVLKHSNFKSWQDMIDHVNRVEGGIIWLPLYLYDHSGITISTTGFRHIDSAQWDWGQVGFIYVTKKKARGEYIWKGITAARTEKVLEALRSEVETYDQYLTGDVYRYTVIKPDGEEGDSCGGFFGSDNEKSGLLENAQNSIDCEIKHTLETVGVQQELALA
jgi:hypothetical protein